MPSAAKGRPEGKRFLEVMTRCQGHVLSCAFVLGQCLDLTIMFPPCMGQKLAARCIGKAFLLLRPTRALYLLRASTSSHHMVLYRNGGRGAVFILGDDGLRMLQADSPNREEGFASQIQVRQSNNQLDYLTL